MLAPCCVAAAASPPGTLAQLAGAGGCVSLQTALGCTPARGLDDARAVALSPDGRSLYVAAATPASVTAFSVAPGNGLLQQLNLSAGCLASVEQDGLRRRSRARPAPRRSRSRPTTSTSTWPRRRPVRSRASRASRTARSCSSSASPAASTATAVAGCDGGPPLAGADAIAISPDGRFVYVAAATADALLAFSRDAATGRLTPLAGAAGCLRANRTNCAPVTGIDGPSAIAITPDGTSLYVSSATAGTITAFQRDVNTGTLTQLAPGAGCLSDVALADCTPIGGLARASSVVVTPDGLTVVAVGTDDDAVISLRRDPATGALTRVSCVAATAATAGCTVSPLIQGPRAVTIRPGGFVAWVASSRGDSIVTLQLDLATGALTPTAGTAGCLRRWPRWTAARRARSTTRAVSRRAPTARGSTPSARSATASRCSGRSSRPTACPCGPRRWPTRRARSCSRARIRTAIRVTLTILRQPRHGRVGGLDKATGSILYTPAPGYAGSDSFTYTATDGLDTSALGTAVIGVTLPPKAPLVRIRTARTHLLRGGRIHVLVECPAIAIGPCRVAVHLLVKGRSAGYGFARCGRARPVAWSRAPTA